MDFYKHRLAHAHWTWMEGKFCRYHKRPKSKDRASGRAEKHRANQLARKDMEQY